MNRSIDFLTVVLCIPVAFFVLCLLAFLVG